jgi:dimethylhistidine N-methyltransferase
MHPQLALTLADEVRAGLVNPHGRTLPAKALYDQLGSALFDAITLLPEYGLTRADIRLLTRYSAEIAALSGASEVVELGSGSGVKTRILLSAFEADVLYRPIDVSAAALERCRQELNEFIVQPVEGEFIPGLALAAKQRGRGSILVAFLGSNIGNFERPAIPPFLSSVRGELRAGDTLLLGADLVKPAAVLIEAYDDPPGVTAAFNKNLLARLNREFDGDFDLRCFSHEVRWNESERRIEMHLRAVTDQRVRLRLLDLDLFIRAGETIWTESSHKFEVAELARMAAEADFELLKHWTDAEWPFTEMVFRAR